MSPSRFPSGAHVERYDSLQNLPLHILQDPPSRFPLVRRGSTPRQGPSVRQRIRPAYLSGRQGGLWRRSFGLAWAPALHEPHLTQLHVAPVFRCVVIPAATTQTVLAVSDTHRRGEICHRRGLRIRSYAASGKNAGNTKTALVLMAQHKTSPSLADRRARWIISFRTPQPQIK